MIVRYLTWSIDNERIVEDYCTSINPIPDTYWYTEQYNPVDQTKEIVLCCNVEPEYAEERDSGYSIFTQNDIRETLMKLVSATIQKDIKSLRMRLEGLNASIEKEL